MSNAKEKWIFYDAAENQIPLKENRWIFSMKVFHKPISSFSSELAINHIRTRQ